ncbi:MAG: hypothetical protein ACR2MP_18940 [Streptosporangiaceae bacterium]
MDGEALEHVRRKLEEDVQGRFPGAGVQRVTVAQYGDEPVIEPGELAVRVIIEAPGGRADREQAMDLFSKAHREAIGQFRQDLSLRFPEARRLEFRTPADDDLGDGEGSGPRIQLIRAGRSLESRAQAGGDLTPVMARLGPVDLETLDALITAGIAANRADAVRWTLARIRERPAYAQLRERAREIERLKTEF